VSCVSLGSNLENAESCLDEGVALRVNAIAAISLLNRMSFAEQQYEAADLHMRALQNLTAQRLRQLPDFCWLVVVWSDLHLTAVQLRVPYIEYYVHPDFRARPFSGKFQFDMDTYLCRILPSEPAISRSFRTIATRLYQDLRECGYAYDQKDLDWKVFRGMSYDIAYLLAETQVEIEKDGTLEEKLITIGCQIQFWGMLHITVPQSGLQSFHMSRLTSLLASIQPSALCKRWLEHTGSLDLILWCLCNAVRSALYLQSNGALPPWLQDHVSYIKNLLGIANAHDLGTRLHSLPRTKSWNEPAYRAFCSLAPTYEDSSARTNAMSHFHVEVFRDLRLDLDLPSSSPHSEE
jgi:hypothetical protein